MNKKAKTMSDFLQEASVDETLQQACTAIAKAQEQGASLIVYTGAGMSVLSGVPVFRGADGTMSTDFLKFLSSFNAARKRAGLDEVTDWFDFSVPSMFQPETAKEAWDYWRWRTLRAIVEPSSDYRSLGQLMSYFRNRTFVQTSNCDQLHVKDGLSPLQVYEIHGTLGRLQCAGPCCGELLPADDDFILRLRTEPNWVPMCPRGCGRCLRPNVMIFGDDALVDTAINAQQKRFSDFLESSQGNYIVLEIGGGVVVPSIRSHAEEDARKGLGLVRINPSQKECSTFQSQQGVPHEMYWPLPLKGADALGRIVRTLRLQQHEVHVIHRTWPYSILRVRKSPDGDVVGEIPNPSHPVQTAILGLFLIFVDVSRSTSTHWKLLPGSKSRLASAGYLTADFDDYNEGWIIKEYNSCPAIEYYCRSRH
jgi:NAD-dependent SIR2 family protein deacetylase